MLISRNSNGLDPNTFLGEQIPILNEFLTFWIGNFQNQFFGHIKGSGASSDFRKPYSESGEKTASDEQKFSISKKFS